MNIWTKGTPPKEKGMYLIQDKDGYISLIEKCDDFDDYYADEASWRSDEIVAYCKIEPYTEAGK